MGLGQERSQALYNTQPIYFHPEKCLLHSRKRCGRVAGHQGGQGRERQGGTRESGVAYKWVCAVNMKHRISNPSGLFQLTDELRE